MDHRLNRPRIVNFIWDIQGKITYFLHLLSVSVFQRFWYFISSLIRKGCALLDAHKERILAMLFFVLEAVSVVLDQIGKNKEAFLLAALLLSLFGFSITLYSLIEARTNPTSKAEIQLKVVEIVFSLIQLIVTFIQYLFTVLKVKNDYNASAFPLAFAMIAVVFIFIKDDSSAPEILPHSTFEQPIGTSIPIELNHNVSWPGSSTNHDKPESSTVKRSTHALNKKVVMKFEINDDEAKEKALGTVPNISGVDSIFIDMKSNIWTIIGNIVEEDVIKLSKICKTGQVSVEPAEKPVELMKPEIFELVKAYQSYNPSWISAKPERRKKPIGSMTSTPSDLNQIVSWTNQARPESSKSHVKLGSSKDHNKPESSTNQVKPGSSNNHDKPGSSTVKRSTHAHKKKVVMKLEINDVEAKKNALDTVVDISGVDSFSMDMNNELKVKGNIVAEDVVIKLRKICKTELVSVKPAKGSDKEGKKLEPKERTENIAELVKLYKPDIPYKPYKKKIKSE